MTDNTNIIKEASQRNTLKDLVDGAYAAIQLGEIESARVMLKSALALIEKGEVLYEQANTVPPMFLASEARLFGPINAGGTKGKFLVIPLEQS